MQFRNPKGIPVQRFPILGNALPEFPHILFEASPEEDSPGKRAPEPRGDVSPDGVPKSTHRWSQEPRGFSFSLSIPRGEKNPLFNTWLVMRALDPGFCTELRGKPKENESSHGFFETSSLIASFALLLPLSGFPWYYTQLSQLYRQSQENCVRGLRPLGML